jgi:hypothetical protein
MVDHFSMGCEFFALLAEEDERIARRIAEAKCPTCGGPLHRSDYDRKPRGALIAPAGEAFVRRFSLCCGREGCRRRTLPPSLRFLGQRVYLGAVVILASVLAQALATVAEIRQMTGIPARTTRRWLAWWRGPFISTEVFLAVRARLIGVETAELPASIMGRLEGSWRERARTLLDLLGPITAKSVPDRSRVSRDIA